MNPILMLQKGLALHRAGLLNEAESMYRQLLAKRPHQADALYLLGLIVQQKGAHQDAVALFSRATKANPKAAAPFLQLGFSLHALKKTNEAITAFASASTLDPKLAEAQHQLGNCHREQREFQKALSCLREAVRLSPNDAVIWLSCGLACMDCQLKDDAVQCFQNSVRLNPKLPEAREILGQALYALHRTEEAREQLMEALTLRPDFHEAHHDLGRVYADEGLMREAIEHYRMALGSSEISFALSNLLFLMHYLPETTPESHFAEHEKWEQLFASPLRAEWKPHENVLVPDRRLKVGYLSPDFRKHPVALFFEPILAGHKRDGFEVFCYANVGRPDNVTESLKKQADQWRNIAGMADAEVADLVRRDGIDILVDLAGHTSNHSLLVFARKPAPIQLTWIGYPNTTGLKAMDYRITDGISDPPGLTDQWHTEKLLRMPDAFLCYRPSEKTPDVGPLPALRNGHVTFASFNNFKKISDPTIALWARLLNEVPGARLLVHSPDLDREPLVARLRDRFAKAGVGGDCIEISGGMLSAESHLGSYNRVDIALDPFPYNGTTTTCEALWMGVPVVTLSGRTHVSRVGTSLVTNIGFREWATESSDAYVARCKELAGNLNRLAEIRQQLREKMQQSPLCDESRFIQNLETAYRKIWRDWCEHQAPVARAEAIQ